MAIYIGSSKKTIRIGSSITRTLLIPELASIVVTAPPTQTEYNPFMSFNPAGMVVTAEYDNGEKKTITDYTITNGDHLTADMTSVTISYTARGITKTTTQDIRVNHIKLDIPYSNETFVYTGSEMTPVWTGYDSSLMTIGGDTSGMNAGTYTVTFTLNDKVNYTWADGTTADKSVTWTISKAQASITLDKTSVVLNADKATETVTFSSVGMKSVIVMSSDTSVATVSMDGNVITISSVNETTGTANIIISGEVNSNYNAPEYPSIEISAEFVPPVTITLKRKSGMYQNPEKPHGWIVVNGQTYYAEETPTEIPVKTGTTITCCNTAGVQVNGQYVSNGGVDYEYAVNSEIIIEIISTHVSDTQYLGIILITEIRNNPATVTIISATSNSQYASVEIDGTVYGNTMTTDTRISVPAGTVARCKAKGGMSSSTVKILRNGTEIKSGTGTVEVSYDYVITGNVMFSILGIGTTCTVTIAETYAVNLNTVANGTLTAPGTSNAGLTVTLTPIPNEGYMYGGAIVIYTLDGVEQTIELDASTKTFTMPAADVTVTPVWSEKPPTAIVTVTHDAYDTRYFWTSCSTVADGQTIWLGEGTYELPIGTVITCEGGVSFSQSRSASMKIYLNGQVVAETYPGNTYGDGSINRCSYEYTLNGNITIDPHPEDNYSDSTTGYIDIIEE